MTTPLLDITGDVCPMTFVKVKMGRVTNVSRGEGIFLMEVTKGG
jgi:TusA-related sulfurtransferase